MTTSWGKKSSSLYTVGRKLEDGAMYIIDLEDMCPAGVLVRAYKQETSDRYTLSVSEGEVSWRTWNRCVAETVCCFQHQVRQENALVHSYYNITDMLLWQEPDLAAAGRIRCIYCLFYLRDSQPAEQQAENVKPTEHDPLV